MRSKLFRTCTLSICKERNNASVSGLCKERYLAEKAPDSRDAVYSLCISWLRSLKVRRFHYSCVSCTTELPHTAEVAATDRPTANETLSFTYFTLQGQQSSSSFFQNISVTISYNICQLSLSAYARYFRIYCRKSGYPLSNKQIYALEKAD